MAKLVSSSLNLLLVPCTIGLGLFMIAYTAVGGLWAVMVTDILQFVVLSAAVFILLPLSLEKVGGFDRFTKQVPDGFFDLLNGEYTFGFVVAFVIYHICYIGGNWTFVQRYTSVDNPKSARNVAFLFAGLYLISPVIWISGGAGFIVGIWAGHDWYCLTGSGSGGYRRSGAEYFVNFRWTVAGSATLGFIFETANQPDNALDYGD